MAVTENFYSCELVEDRCEVHFRCGGFWNPEIMRAFLDKLNETTKPLIKAGKPVYSLGDFSEALPQDRETAAMVATHLENAKKFGLKRVALINATPLMQMQYKRVSSGLDVAFFETKATALNWLRADR